MTQPVPSTNFHPALSDELHHQQAIPMELAQEIFDYFQSEPLFRWSDANNDCEDRANAICILLDAWDIPNYKAWVFSGYFLRKNLGSLLNYWNYHVAALLPVQDGNDINYYVVDPSTATALMSIEDWALQITASDTSYHCIKHSGYYIFPPGKIKNDNWYKRNKRNYNWTIQGLSGINGMSSKGKALLAFRKPIVHKAGNVFNKLKNQKPRFLK